MKIAIHAIAGALLASSMLTSCQASEADVTSSLLLASDERVSPNQPSSLTQSNPPQINNRNPTTWIGTSRKTAERIMGSKNQNDVNPQAIGDKIAFNARSFLGFPYTSYSLDQLPRETLRIDLTSFDCFLFIEQILALTISRSAESFQELVQNLRYTNGDVSFCHRIHYFTTWAENAESMGLIHNLTPQLPGAEARMIHLNYMSAHPSSYKPMRDTSTRECIRKLESSLTKKQTFVPVSKISTAIPYLRNGDIFGLVTRVGGLDVTHVGFIDISGTGADAIHAAPGPGVMRSRNIAAYSKRVQDVIGVTFYRPTGLSWADRQAAQK